MLSRLSSESAVARLSLVPTFSARGKARECSSRVQQIELAIEPAPGRSDGGGVGEHAKGARNLGEVSIGDDGGRLVADSELEAGGAPVDELDSALVLWTSEAGVSGELQMTPT